MASTWYWVRQPGDDLDRITPNAGRAEAVARRGGRVTACTAPSDTAAIDTLLSR